MLFHLGDYLSSLGLDQVYVLLLLEKSLLSFHFVPDFLDYVLVQGLKLLLNVGLIGFINLLEAVVLSLFVIFEHHKAIFGVGF